MFKANQLGEHLDAWKTIANNTVVSWLVDGVCISCILFTSIPPELSLANHKLSKEQALFIDSEIVHLVSSGATKTGPLYHKVYITIRICTIASAVETAGGN